MHGRPAIGDGAPAAVAPIANALTVDVEDYFQVSAFAAIAPRHEWGRWPGRVEANTERVLGIFADAGVRATFFTLGWVAERHPALVRRIVAEGHELASHGFQHDRVRDQKPEAFRADVRRTRLLLEQLGGTAVVGYRAASFSIGADTPWAHRVLAEEGYRYSSSVYPVRHDHYGDPDAPRFAYRPDDGVPLIELPLTTLRLGRRNLPCAGGGYFRLLPYGYFRWAWRRVNRREGMPAIFYVHPWEVDPAQPRPVGLAARTRFRHYVNLSRTEPRMRRMLRDFRWDRLDRVFGIA